MFLSIYKCVRVNQFKYRRYARKGCPGWEVANYTLANSARKILYDLIHTCARNAHARESQVRRVSACFSSPAAAYETSAYKSRRRCRGDRGICAQLEEQSSPLTIAGYLMLPLSFACESTAKLFLCQRNIIFENNIPPLD